MGLFFIEIVYTYITTHICNLRVEGLENENELKEHLKEMHSKEGEMPNQFWTDSKSKTCGKYSWSAPYPDTM